MNKTRLFLGLIIFLTTFSVNLFAQNTQGAGGQQPIYVSGVVKANTGDPLHYAFIQDKRIKSGSYTDSLGNFSLNVYPNSKLWVSCYGFKDTVINISNQTSFLIVMSIKPGEAATGPAATADDANNINMMSFSDKLNSSGTNMNIDAAQGAIFPVVHHKEATQGSRYLFDGWVHGYVLNNQDSIVQNSLFLFNYDKIGGNLLLTKDRHAAVELVKSAFKSFTLFDAMNQKHTFTMVPDIDKTHFVEILNFGTNYAVYKNTATKFVASNYSSDGIASTGNNYDEYTDDYTYYLQNVKTGQIQKLVLKRKALKTAFADKADKVNKFLKDNDGDIDESYIANLCDYMNK